MHPEVVRLYNMLSLGIQLMSSSWLGKRICSFIRVVEIVFFNQLGQCQFQ